MTASKNLVHRGNKNIENHKEIRGSQYSEIVLKGRDGYDWRIYGIAAWMAGKAMCLDLGGSYKGICLIKVH
jgi:hypothetical protein